MIDFEIRLTQDGSHTIFAPEVNESYHSQFGAISESRHIFINAALRPVLAKKNNISILEVGFGTGLNALLTLKTLEEEKIFCNYTAFETNPLSKSVITSLNYPGILEIVTNTFITLACEGWGKTIALNPQFNIHKINGSIISSSLPEEEFDIVYFDAFSPDALPELWTFEIFSKVFVAMKYEGILTTFSSKGIVKRAMQTAGFSVEKLQGPHGKREILRAIKK
mgnify:CR=1 FL=1